MDVDQLLRDFEPLLTSLCAKFAVPGLSIGILKGEDTHFLNIGLRNPVWVPDQAPDEDTLYLASGMTKPFLVVAIHILAARGQLNLHARVKDYILIDNDTLVHKGRSLQICDLLSHRSEYPSCDMLWEGRDGAINIQTAEEISQLYCHMTTRSVFQEPQDFDNTLNYNNFTFGILAIIIEKVSHMKWTDFLDLEILKPLGMTRSTVDMDAWQGTLDDDNVACGHCSVPRTISGWWKDPEASLDHSAVARQFRTDIAAADVWCQPRPIPISTCGDEPTYIGAAAGLRSTTRDLLRFYERWIDLFNAPETLAYSDLDEGILESQRILGHPKLPSYVANADGWNIARIPWDGVQRAPGADSENFSRLSWWAGIQQALDCDDKHSTPAEFWPFFRNRAVDAPVPPGSVEGPPTPISYAGTSCLCDFASLPRPTDPLSSREPALFHGGHMVGATSFAMMLPRRNLAVVVLANARSFYLDMANLVGMAITDCIFRGQKTVNNPVYLGQIRSLADSSAACYQLGMVLYNRNRAAEFESEPAPGDRFADLIGLYHLTDNIYAEVMLFKESGTLKFVPPGESWPYQLHVQKDWANPMEEGRVIMSFAPSAEELHASGLGGERWLDSNKFRLKFKQVDQSRRHWKLVWKFDSLDATEKSGKTYDWIRRDVIGV